MLILAISAIIVGAVLGVRFKVFILVPALAISSVVAFAIGVAHSNGLWPIVLAMILATSALQTGYLGGAIIRLVSARAPVRKASHGITVQSPLPEQHI